MARAEEAPGGTPDENYLPVGRDLPSWSVWSNDPEDMQLETYFNTDPDVPGLAEQFGLPGLKPVIVRPSHDLGNKYLLIDETGAYFLWNEMQPELWRFKSKTGIRSLSDVINMVCTDSYGNEDLLPQFNPEIARQRRRGG
ncbi:hypothetical protein FSHL1_010178 [Fusarium sambucinum]